MLVAQNNSQDVLVNGERTLNRLKTVVIGSIIKLFVVHRERRYHMARPKKNGTYLNVCIDSKIYTELTKLCDEAGQTKTVAVERALLDYFGEYKKKQEMLRNLEEKNG